MLKSLHIALALLSLTGLVMRASWAFTFPDILRERWIRIAPHIVDTLLLVLGVLLWLRLPVEGLPTWLAVKLGFLLLYIAFGFLILRGQGGARWLGVFGAVFAFGYMFAVAVTRQVWFV